MLGTNKVVVVVVVVDKRRSPRFILHYHNSSWYHHILCRDIVGFNLQKMTLRKFYGTYFHDLTALDLLQLRILSGCSSNAEEEEERTFNTVKSMTNTTSNYRPAHIISNIFISLQAEEKFGRSENCVEKQH